MASNAERARRILLEDIEVGPRYVRLSATDQKKINDLLDDGRYVEARREILRLDEIRRLKQKRPTNVMIDGVMIDKSLLPLNGKVPLRQHEKRGKFSFFLYDYQCLVTIREFDGHVREVFTSNLGFDSLPTKGDIARRGILDIAEQINGEVEGSDKIHGTITKIELVVSRRRA